MVFNEEKNVKDVKKNITEFFDNPELSKICCGTDATCVNFFDD